MPKIKNVINLLSNKVYTKIVRSCLKNQNFTIFCNVCIGGVIYSHLGMKFLSPTINLWISTEDFLKFLLNYNSYIKQNWILLVLILDLLQNWMIL